MSIIISIALFLLGMALSVQVIASLYGPLDYIHTIKTKFPGLVLRLLIWGGLSAIIAILLGDRYRPSFLWGLAAYVLFYLLSYLVFKLLPIRNLRILDSD